MNDISQGQWYCGQVRILPIAQFLSNLVTSVAIEEPFVEVQLIKNRAKGKNIILGACSVVDSILVGVGVA